jgi:23S rRNA G2445 N2-methylase RlmL
VEPGRFLVTSAPGLEGLLSDELGEFGLVPDIRPSGAVAVDGGWDVVARVLVRSRLASRVLLPVRRFSARTPAMLYDQVRRIDWPAVFPSSRSMLVEAHGSGEGLDFALSFAPLKIKDAVCDEFRKRGHERPDVDRRDADVRLLAHFFRGKCLLAVDLTGDPLHRRGYRLAGSEAPLRENRAAGLLRFAGYDGSEPFHDPFCGSGTLPVEAALLARRIAPGLLREPDSFAFTRLVPEARDVLEAERAAAAGEILPEAAHPVVGSDLDPEVLEAARANAERAGVTVAFHEGDAREVAGRGTLYAANPPYGERLADPGEAAELLDAFVRRLKHHAVPARLALVLPRGPLEKAVGLRPDRRLDVAGGSLRLRYSLFTLYEGSRKRTRSRS